MSRPPHRAPADHVQIAGRVGLWTLSMRPPLSAEQRDEALARLGSMTADHESPFAASIGSKADDEHDTEGQSIGYERTQLSALTRHAQAHLRGVPRTHPRPDGWRPGRRHETFIRHAHR